MSVTQILILINICTNQLVSLCHISYARKRTVQTLYAKIESDNVLRYINYCNQRYFKSTSWWDRIVQYVLIMIIVVI